MTDEHASSWHKADSAIINRAYCATKFLKPIPYYVWLASILVLLVAYLATILAKSRSCMKQKSEIVQKMMMYTK